MSESGRKRISMQDIADACGVSRNTVSRALRNADGLSKATVKRVRKTAEEMGYTPDPELAKLMTRLRERDKREIRAEVAYVYFNDPEGDRPPHWSYVKPAADLLERKGYRLTPYFMHEERGMAAEKLSAILHARGVEGILLGAMRPGLRRVELPWDSFCGVALGRVLDWPVVPQVDADSYQAVRQCFQYLKNSGCKRIGAIINSGYDVQIRFSLRAGFLQESSRITSGASIPILDFDVPTWRERTLEEIKVWMAEHKLDGVIGFESELMKLVNDGMDPKRVASVHRPLQSKLNIPGSRPNLTALGEALAEQLIYAMQHGLKGSRNAYTLTLVEMLFEA